MVAFNTIVELIVEEFYLIKAYQQAKYRLYFK